MFSLQYTVYYVQFAMYSLQCTVYSLHCKLYSSLLQCLVEKESTDSKETYGLSVLSVLKYIYQIPKSFD